MKTITRLAVFAVAAFLGMTSGALPAVWGWVSTESRNVVALATGGTPTYQSVTDATVPAADPTAYAFKSTTSSGAPVRWGTCEAIPYTVNLTGAPTGALEDVTAAFEQINAATGLSFTFVGETATAPVRKYHEVHGLDAPILVAWVPGSSELVGSDATAGRAYTWDVGGRYRTGMVLFNQELDSNRPGGFDQAGGRGALYLHEFSHVAGLGHVNDHAQIMSPSLGYSASLQAGDLNGLAAIGGC